MMFGCAEMPASDNPLDPVVMEAPVSDPPPALVPPPAQDASAEAHAMIDDLADAAKDIADGKAPTKRKAKAKAKAKMAKAKAKAKRAKAARQVREATRTIGGPIQLVTAIPEAVPPRAILSLPGGKEIVVRPGQMVPEVGLIVLSIQADSVEISRVEPDGHRATVHNEVLIAPVRAPQ
jgi:sRNA-binding protein